MANARDAFRVNFEQQQKRAKDLLKAARAGYPAATARFRATSPKLAEAQLLVARELRFHDWAALKQHCNEMTLARKAMSASVLDSDLRTLHIRCGNDLKELLPQAGLHGDYYEHRYPYLMGPVTEGPDCLRQRARFIVDCYGEMFEPPLQSAGYHQAVESQLQGLEDDERKLHDSADYERVVLWFEHDCHDQLTLIRLLAHYEMYGSPARLELITIGDFPGTRRFIGLGELPPEALRMLWETRQSVSPAQLELGRNAWHALTNSNPRFLADIMRGKTPALPLLAPALHRHLRELPSAANGLSLTEELALALLAQQPQTLAEMFWAMTDGTDPLPGQGDWNLRRRVMNMQRASAPVFARVPDTVRGGHARPPWTDLLQITALGLAVLQGEVDYRSLDPPPRWVGGVEIAAGKVDWRWDDRIRVAVPR